MANAIIKAVFLGDATALNKAFDASQAKGKSWGDKMGDVGKKLTVGLTLPIVAGATAAVTAAAEEEQQMKQLATVIQNNIPNATEAMVAANEDWVGSLQNSIGVADSEIREMEQKFLAAGVSIEESQRLTAMAYDTAAATGKDAASVADAFVKATNGQVSGLSRLGVQVRKSNGEMKSFDEILQDLNTHQGTAAAAADTTAGRAEIMKLKFADLQENLGSVLIPIMEKLVGWLTAIVDWFNNLDPAGQKVVVMILGIAAAVGPVLVVGAKLVNSFKTISTAFTAMSKLFMANPWVLLIAAVVALVVIIVKNWDKIVEAIKTAWEWIKGIVKTASDWIVNLFKNWSLPGLIVKHWDKIKEGVSNLWKWLKDTWNNIVSWFGELPGRIGKAVGGLFDGLKNAFKNAMNSIIDKWNNFKLQIKLPAILGGGTITIDTPNIPRFHTGGIFRAPVSGGQGLALLRDGERVLPPGSRSAGSGKVENHFHINVESGIGYDKDAVAKAVKDAIEYIARRDGGLFLDVALA